MRLLKACECPLAEAPTSLAVREISLDRALLFTFLVAGTASVIPYPLRVVGFEVRVLKVCECPLAAAPTSLAVNEISLDKFTPVTDAIGLSSPSYTFTVRNNTDKEVKYSIKLIANNKKIQHDNCENKQIPRELLKLSFRKDHQSPVAYVLSEFPNDIIYEDSLKPNSSEDYSIRLWAMNSNFTLDKTSHYHALIEVIEE